MIYGPNYFIGISKWILRTEGYYLLFRIYGGSSYFYNIGAAEVSYPHFIIVIIGILEINPRYELGINWD